MVKLRDRFSLALLLAVGIATVGGCGEPEVPPPKRDPASVKPAPPVVQAVQPLPGWAGTLQAIATSAAHGGIRIGRQEGLVPLGPDPESGLQEFAVEGTGSVPRRSAESGRLLLTDDFAIVLVLLPGGEFTMGAQKEDPDHPGYDPRACVDEPLSQVLLAPFFIGKYECTKAQWAMLAGNALSASDLEYEGRRPADAVDWYTARARLAAHGLHLPTEAQWEYACRADTTTPWWTGSDVEGLERAAWFDPTPGETVYSGQRVPPVGTKAPNAFGLHDTHGSQMEWCESGGMPAVKPTPFAYEDRPPDAVESDGVLRGGAWNRGAYAARSAHREINFRDCGTWGDGVRAARAISAPPAGVGAARPSGRLLFVDRFEDSPPKARPLFDADAMAYEQVEGRGRLAGKGPEGVLPVLYHQLKVQDFLAEFEFQATAESQRSWCGLMIRTGVGHYAGTITSYHVFLNPTTGTAFYDCWRCTGWIGVESIELPDGLLQPLEVNRVRVEAVGPELRVFLNGTLVWWKTDPDPREAGTIGLFGSFGKADAGAFLFDNLSVYDVRHP